MPHKTFETKACGSLVSAKPIVLSSGYVGTYKDACGLRVSPSSEKAMQGEAGILELDKAYFRVHLNTKKVADITYDDDET